MNQLLPITSREYKLILNSSRFKQREEGCNQFWAMVEFLITSNKGLIESGDGTEVWKKEERKTWYLDTPSLSLSGKGFSLRVREEKKDAKYKITLKYRSGDRYLSAIQDISSSVDKADLKFEEDIVLPFSSRFSHSCSIETNSLPKLEVMSDVVQIFPGLGKFSIPELTLIERVNNFTAHEICLKTPKRIKFAGRSPKVKACFSFWYLLGKDNEYPLISEFSFDYDVPEEKPSDFPSPDVIEGVYHFFNDLQRFPDWLTSSNSTKTAFAYAN